MIVVCERRVGAALVRQPAMPLALRFGGARLVIAGRLGRSLKRVCFRVTAATVVVLAIFPVVLTLKLLIGAF